MFKAFLGVELIQAPGSSAPQFPRAYTSCRLRISAIEHVLCTLVCKRLNHGSMLARMSCYRNRCPSYEWMENLEEIAKLLVWAS